MTSLKYFCDIGGEVTELVATSHMSNLEFARRFPGIKGIRFDGFNMRVGYAAGAGCSSSRLELPMTRAIKMKSHPTRHECNAKCMNGKHNGTCECQCGGANHGRGMFTQLLQPA